MPVDKEALKAELIANYAEKIKQLVDHLDPETKLDLSDIEDGALGVGAEVEQQITEALVKSQSKRDLSCEECPRCGSRMHYKGMKKKWLRTRSGEVEIERAHYYCQECKQGFFPPG
jgi:uncharacterized protein with PIN domain